MKKKLLQAEKFLNEKLDFLLLYDYADNHLVEIVDNVIREADYSLVNVPRSTLSYLLPPSPSELRAGRNWDHTLVPQWWYQISKDPTKLYCVRFQYMTGGMIKIDETMKNLLWDIVRTHTLCGVHLDNVIIVAEGYEDFRNEEISNYNLPLTEIFQNVIR